MEHGPQLVFHHPQWNWREGKKKGTWELSIILVDGELIPYLPPELFFGQVGLSYLEFEPTIGEIKLINKMKKLSLGDRMKVNYEKPYNFVLPLRLPIIIRLDGRAFHAFTRDFERPFDKGFIETMQHLAGYLCDEVASAVFAYIQSDEISLLLHNYKKFDTQPWFGNEIQKIVSIASGLASSWMTNSFVDYTNYSNRLAVFDARAFVLPEAEVVNYFIWRQQDWTRNSLQMLARSHYSHKQLYHKNSIQIHDMLMEKGVNWNKQPVYIRRGSAVYHNKGDIIWNRWKIDTKPPVFSKNRNFIQKWLKVEEE